MSWKKFWLLGVLLPLFYSDQANCSSFNGTCYSKACYNPCPSWTVYGDWLYWRARRCQLDYALPFVPFPTNTSIGDVSKVLPRYESGFRVGFSKQCGKLFFDAFYTHFHPDARRTTIDSSGFLAGTHVIDEVGGVTQGQIALAKGKWNLDYDVADLLAGYSICSRSCIESYVFGGFKYARFYEKMVSDYSANLAMTGIFSRATQKNDLNAYGVDIGVGAKYTIGRCINLFGRISYDVLLGQYNRLFAYDVSANGGVTTTRPVELKEDGCWGMLSTYNLFFGLGYDYSFCNYFISRMGVSVGYEFHEWINMLDFLEFSNEPNDHTIIDRHLESLGFDGLFVRVNIGF